jgi:Type II secretion system (T2SS), protein E, N-terminal domain
MVTSALTSLLLGGGVISRRRLAEAERRRAVYGGALDTVLLEMGALDEATLAASLAEAAGLPVPPPGRLVAPDPDASEVMAAADAHRLRAAPLGRRPGGVELALHPDADRTAVAAWAEAATVNALAFAVPEVRFQELLTAVYAEPLPPRFCTLLGRLMGAAPARRRARALAPPPAPGPPPVDTGPSLRPRPRPALASARAFAAGHAIAPAPEPAPQPRPEPEIEPEIDIVEEAPVPPPDLEGLLRQARESRDPEEALRAIAGLAELRAAVAVPLLIDLVADDRRAVAEAARAALRTVTRQDFADSRRGWLGWWHRASGRHRMEWLLEALGHKRADLRLAAAEELQATTGVYVGYHFDLPERDRDEARRRWTEWWHTIGKARFAGDGRS